MNPVQRTAVLVDPYPLWLDAVENVISRNGVAVVGRTTDPLHAIALVEEFAPDVLVAEPEPDGLGAVREACERVPGLKAIVLSASSDPAQIQAAFAAGAVAYVLKTAQPEDVGIAIRQAFEHSVFVPNPGAVSVSSNGIGSSAKEAVAALTKRELEILQLVAEGHSNSQLARSLWVTEQTVKFHLSNIYRKIEVTNRTEASRWAQVHGLLDTSAHALTASAAGGGSG
jgi:DNA-binding NarL/FixJ family response regulator